MGLPEFAAAVGAMSALRQRHSPPRAQVANSKLLLHQFSLRLWPLSLCLSASALSVWISVWRSPVVVCRLHPLAAMLVVVASVLSEQRALLNHCARMAAQSKSQAAFVLETMQTVMTARHCQTTQATTRPRCPSLRPCAWRLLSPLLWPLVCLWVGFCHCQQPTFVLSVLFWLLLAERARLPLQQGPDQHHQRR